MKHHKNVPEKVKRRIPDKALQATLALLLERFREFANQTSPPGGRKNCKDCKRMNLWLDTTSRLRNSDHFLRNADSMQRESVLRYRIRDHRVRPFASSGDWENGIGSHDTNCFDSISASWDRLGTVPTPDVGSGLAEGHKTQAVQTSRPLLAV